MSTKRMLKKANSLHVQMIFAMLLASIIPLLIVLVQMMNGEELSPLPKMQAQLVERESVKLLHGKAEEEE